jgi:photoactive yellow protein
MMEFTAPPEPRAESATTPTDPMQLDGRSDQELDTLPFGVIALDDEGTILRYNLYEAQFARLDRNQVLGRDFFKWALFLWLCSKI